MSSNYGRFTSVPRNWMNSQASIRCCLCHHRSWLLWTAKWANVFWNVSIWSRHGLIVEDIDFSFHHTHFFVQEDNLSSSRANNHNLDCFSFLSSYFISWGDNWWSFVMIQHIEFSLIFNSDMFSYIDYLVIFCFFFLRIQFSYNFCRQMYSSLLNREHTILNQIESVFKQPDSILWRRM